MTSAPVALLSMLSRSWGVKVAVLTTLLVVVKMTSRTRSEGVLGEAIRVTRAGERNQCTVGRWGPMCEGIGIVWKGRHGAGRIATRCSLVRHMRPLCAGVMRRWWWGRRSAATGLEGGRIVVVVVETVRMGGLGPSAPRTPSVIQRCVPALRPLT